MQDTQQPAEHVASRHTTRHENGRSKLHELSETELREAQRSSLGQRAERRAASLAFLEQVQTRSPSPSGTPLLHLAVDKAVRQKPVAKARRPQTSPRVRVLAK